MRSFNDVWFGTLSETCDCWTEDSAALAPGQLPCAPARRAHILCAHYGHDAAVSTQVLASLPSLLHLQAAPMAAAGRGFRPGP